MNRTGATKVIINDTPSRLYKAIQDSVHEPSTTVPPFSIYEEIRHRPYTADYFDIGHYEFMQKNQDIDVDHMLDRVDKVEKFVQWRIMKERLQDNVQSYDKIVRNLANKLGVQRFKDKLHVFNIISSYLLRTRRS